MMIDRRDLLTSAAALTVVSAFPSRSKADTAFIAKPGSWRTFETVTRFEIVKPAGKVQAWIPLPSVDEAEWFKPGESTWVAANADAEIAIDAKSGAKMLHAAWPEGASSPVVEVTSRFSTRDRSVDLAAKPAAIKLSDEDRKRFTAATEFIPVTGLVKETADKITAGSTSELDKARKIYDWVVENTFRNPKTKGCGLGDVTFLLKSGDLSGKCADLNALFAGLARAAGMPARDIYGLRVAPSQFGYKSLGPSTAVVTKAQHCRADVFVEGYGWIPADPADVRKVVLEEPPGNLALSDAKVTAARQTLFGAYEMNWLAYNFASDVALPGSAGPKLAFLMYPQAETAAGRLDCLDPDNAKYTILAREIVS